jgi:hypothetical protein
MKTGISPKASVDVSPEETDRIMKWIEEYKARAKRGPGRPKKSKDQKEGQAGGKRRAF